MANMFFFSTGFYVVNLIIHKFWATYAYFFYISWLGHSLVLIHMCIFMDASIDSRANNSASTIEFHLLPSSFIDFHIIYHPIYP